MSKDPGIIERQAIAAGFGEGADLAFFRRGYSDRGRYGANGEAAGVGAVGLPAYRAGIASRLAFDLAEGARRQPPETPA